MNNFNDAAKAEKIVREYYISTFGEEGIPEEVTILCNGSSCLMPNNDLLDVISENPGTGYTPAYLFTCSVKHGKLIVVLKNYFA